MPRPGRSCQRRPCPKAVIFIVYEGLYTVFLSNLRPRSIKAPCPRTFGCTNTGRRCGKDGHVHPGCRMWAVPDPNLSAAAPGRARRTGGASQGLKGMIFFGKSAKKGFDRPWPPPYKPPPRGHGVPPLGRDVSPQVKSIEGLARTCSLWPSKRSNYG